MNDTALYISKRTARSLWQEYCVYGDRVELKTLLGQMTIPLKRVEQVTIAGPTVARLVKGDFGALNLALKLDWTDFTDHVVLKKNSGCFRLLAFTPKNPAAFVRTLEEALARFKERKSVHLSY